MRRESGEGAYGGSDRPLYDAVNSTVVRLVPEGAKTVLDIGCGTGLLGHALKQRRPSLFVHGMTISEREAEQCRGRLDYVTVGDADRGFEGIPDAAFDCVVCSHVLEHLVDPWRALRALTTKVSPGGSVLIALPNVLYLWNRVAFLRGHFRYEEWGIMDRTHLRFFDLESARKLVTGAGLSIEMERLDGHLPLSRFLSRVPASGLDGLALRWAPGLFADQFVFRAELRGRDLVAT